MKIVVRKNYANWHPLDDWNEGGFALLDSNSVSIEAYKEGMQVGYCTLINKNNNYYIYDLSTHPDYRNQGIATKVLKKCIGYSKSRNGTSIRLRAQNNDKKLKKFYNKLFPTFNGKTKEQIKYL